MARAFRCGKVREFQLGNLVILPIAVMADDASTLGAVQIPAFKSAAPHLIYSKEWGETILDRAPDGTVKLGKGGTPNEAVTAFGRRSSVLRRTSVMARIVGIIGF